MAPRRRPEARPAPRRTPMAVRPGRRPPPAPVADPRRAPAAAAPALDPATARAGRRAALVLVGTGVFWAVAFWAGDALGLSQRVRALLDLFALAGFGLALFMTFQVWRMRRAAPE